MYQINLTEPSDEFVKAWNIVGQHIQNKLDSDLVTDTSQLILI